jgi:hypothetical protein
MRDCASSLACDLARLTWLATDLAALLALQNAGRQLPVANPGTNCSPQRRAVTLGRRSSALGSGPFS